MKRLIIIISLLLITVVANSQEKWVLKSKYLAQPDTVLIYKPDNYTKSKKYPLVYLLHGYSENFKQWSQITNLQKLANRYNFIIVTPEGFSSYYINSPLNKGSRYEDFFFKELVPKVHYAYQIEDKNIFISGLSMGGYGALRYFILHSDYFNSAGSTSGALEIDYSNFRKVSQAFWQSYRMTDDMIKNMGDPALVNWNEYSISSILKQHPQFKKPFLIDCGTEDILYPATIAIKILADSLHIPITFSSQPGNHHADYWAKSIEFHFVYFNQRLIK